MNEVQVGRSAFAGSIVSDTAQNEVHPQYLNLRGKVLTNRAFLFSYRS